MSWILWFWHKHYFCFFVHLSMKSTSCGRLMLYWLERRQYLLKVKVFGFVTTVYTVCLYIDEDLLRAFDIWILLFSLAWSTSEGSKCSSRPSLYQIKRPKDLRTSAGIKAGEWQNLWKTVSEIIKTFKESFRVNILNVVDINVYTHYLNSWLQQCIFF